MFPYWDIAIAPVLEASEVQRLVEIGALRGDNTRQIIERLGPGAELHVVDPAPDFDPTEHEQAFAGQYVFHHGLSLDVLRGLPPMDAVLIDGDHNWYTVINELRQIRDVARAAGAELPVLILHDVGWPYGRRDLYYAPETIPAEHRQPHRKAGMRVGNPGLARAGGMSAGHWNAEREGGPRNGVMTALEDFLAEHDEPTRTVVLPPYFGLAIVAAESRLGRQPALTAVLDHLESAEGRLALLELGEELRVRAVAHNHTLLGQRDRRIQGLARRYLDGAIKTITKEYYREDDSRLLHLLDVARGGDVNWDVVRDPVRYGTLNATVDGARRVGEPTATETQLGLPVPATGGSLMVRAFEQALEDVRADGIPGDVFVCGAGGGASALFARAHLVAHELTDRQLWVADPFRADTGTDLNMLRDRFHRLDLLDPQVRFLQGDPRATLPAAPPGPIATLVFGSSDPDVVQAGFDHLYPRLAEGGLVVVEDATDPAVRQVVEEFRRAHGLTETISGIGPTGTTWRKGQASSSVIATPTTGLFHAPPAGPAVGEIDLSVVVVFFNMDREAPRTLRSLSRAYQLDVDDISYEVIAVENGSAPDRRLGEEMVTSFGSEFRYLDLGPEATPSPADALNAGIAASRGRALALMVDGAHVLTPRVLHYGLTGLETYTPAIVATQQWYLGPGQQGDVMRSGYDQEYEDQLFDRIAWPSDGYRLFDIGHFVGDRDWLDGLWESNCLFVTRQQLEQVGGFDQGFAMAGGGYTNLDLYERLGSSPDTTIVSILGEGSFHQVHGGTTTNLVDSEERRSRVRGYADHYRELRGRSFRGPEKPIHYVGALVADGSKRSRGRRLTGAAFEVDPSIEGDGGGLGRATPIPDEQRDSFIHAYWRSRAWQQVTWLGQAVPAAPADLLAYQDLIAEIRPDWIIETGTKGGGRAMFLASVCDLVGQGRIISIDMQQPDSLPEHPRVTYLAGSPVRGETMQGIRELTGSDPKGLVILGTRGRRNRMVDEFEALAPLVAPGSYAVIEHTVLNGRPIDASHGPGPFEAMRILRERHPNFIVDHEREKQAVTFNLNGFMKRIR